MTRLIAITTLLTILTTGGCSGEILDQEGELSAEQTGTEEKLDPDSLTPVVPKPEEPPEPEEPPFELSNDKVELLPFEVRMNKLAGIVGLPASDPVFDELYERRYDLGDHNFAEGIGADLSWSASQMAIWVEGLRPVCGSGAFTAAYPDLGIDDASLEALMHTAWARPPHSDEIAGVRVAVSEAGVAAELQHEVICLAVLSSLEFVSR